ncbi:MAG: YCF48-related protein [Chloroflexota bacterium]|nr:YCF48-related protein [Chloroflexota bacterium]
MTIQRRLSAVVTTILVGVLTPTALASLIGCSLQPASDGQPRDSSVVPVVVGSPVTNGHTPATGSAAPTSSPAVMVVSPTASVQAAGQAHPQLDKAQLPPTTASPAARATAMGDPRGNSVGDLTAVSFSDASHGWLAVSAAILATSDGGQSWSYRYTGASEVQSLSFVSETMGWAATRSGLIATRDGGASWTPVRNVGSGNTGLYGVDFTDARNGWVASVTQDDTGTQAILHTVDGGSTWQAVAKPCLENWLLGPLRFISANTGYVVCAGGGGALVQPKQLFKTMDAARTWQLVQEVRYPEAQPATGHNLSLTAYAGELFFLDKVHGWFATQDRGYGSLQATSDGGRTWRDVRVGRSSGVEWSLSFTGPDHGYVIYKTSVGMNDSTHYTSALLETQDGGANWRQLYPALSPAGHSQYLDAGTGFGVGTALDPTIILRTQDGGSNWKQMGALADWCHNPGGSCEKGCVWSIPELNFTDPTHGTVLTRCEWSGTTTYTRYTTTDSGSRWSPAAVPSVPEPHPMSPPPTAPWSPTHPSS